jgi:hypothetical protein
MNLKSVLALALCGSVCVNNAVAQLDNDILKRETTLVDADTNKLFFNLNSLNFLRNTEYFGPIESGKTYFGYMLNPTLSYQASPIVKVSFGGVFRKDFGNNALPIAAPTFAVKVSKNGISGIFGNYESAMSHRFIEPLFNIDYALSKPLENGLQFKVDRKRIFSDTWIDWQKMIYQGSPFKEEISAGTSNMFMVLGADKRFQISIPAQATVHHFGGQIDTLRSTPLTTEINTAVGLRLAYHFADSAFFKEIRSDNYYVTYTDESHVNKHPYNSGSGIYLNLLLRTKYLNLLVSYWEGSQYIAPNGTTIYQSANISDPTLALNRDKNRQLLFTRLFFEKKLAQGLDLNVRFEPFYEFSRSAVDFSYSVYLRYQLKVKVATIKPHFN